MIEELRTALGPWYLYIKAIHVLSAAIWSFSTAVAWGWYLKPAFRAAHRRPEDPTLRARRDALMERFDRGASLEHAAFAVLVPTALLLIWIGRVDLARWSSVSAMLWIGVVVIVPMEAIDLHLSHLGGNKARIRALGDPARYERAMERHWRFLRVTEPIVMLLVPAMFVIAIAKPF
jgi:hypothetical protein